LIKMASVTKTGEINMSPNRDETRSNGLFSIV
jgi:hypothetical protein